MKKITAWVGIGLALWVVIYFTYPRIIVDLYGKDIPHEWSINYAEMNLGQIYQAIGEPQDELWVKGASWIKEYWWGTKRLKLSCGYPLDKNKPNGMWVSCQYPRDKNVKTLSIHYMVFVHGWYGSMYSQVILK